jgi:hypothetical protein
MPKVFEGSLKDYQGLEGVSDLCAQFIHMWSQDKRTSVSSVWLCNSNYCDIHNYYTYVPSWEWNRIHFHVEIKIVH